MENLMLEVMYELPQREDVTEVVIDAAVVAGRRKPTLRKSAEGGAQARRAPESRAYQCA
jgi:ATP-dependent Clp protease ATP-binding subunit ClpX